jgi:hypothetical protein
MIDIEALKAKHAAEVEAAVRENDMELRVKAVFADATKVSRHAYRSDCFVEIAADTLPDALLRCERSNPISGARVKGSCLSFIPERKVTEKEYAECDVRLVPYFYTIDGLRQHAEDKTLTWFIDIDGLTVEVRCKVKNDPLTRRDYHITFDKHGNGSRARNDLINGSGEFPNRDRFWSSNDQPSRWVVYP